MICEACIRRETVGLNSYCKECIDSVNREVFKGSDFYDQDELDDWLLRRRQAATAN